MTTPPGTPPPYGDPAYGQPAHGQSGYGQPGYGAPGQPYPPPPPLPYSAPGGFTPPPQKTNWWAIVSLVSGVLGGVLISVVCGIVGLRKAREGHGGRGLAIAGLVLSGLWVVVLIAGVAFYFAMGKGTVTATNVAVGDCLAEIPDGSRVLTVKTVGCDQQHAGEVFAVLNMPDGDFPGEATVEKFSDGCGPALASYAPAIVDDPSIGVYVLYPTQETWDQGDRAVTCVATLEPPRTGSIKG
jgi:hypothetical protein